ncbi:MAG: S24/S26 family peptidase [Oscillibacter sp.]|nr:S24/S26 family peptidase [Oscillibacter sp.]
MSAENFERVLAEQGELLLPISGVSMLPLLEQDRDAVHLVPAAVRLQRGDMALFRRANGELVLHRVVRVRPDGYFIIGDNNPQMEFVKNEQIRAVADGYCKGETYVPCTDETYRAYARAHSGYFLRAMRWRAMQMLSRLRK